MLELKLNHVSEKGPIHQQPSCGADSDVIVTTTTSGAASQDKVITMTILNFRCVNLELRKQKMSL